MASKTTAKKPATSGKPATAKHGKPAAKSSAKPARPAAKPARPVTKPTTRSVTKPMTKPTTRTVTKPATRPISRSGTGKVARALRADRHDKPGTGRVSRAVSADRVREVNGSPKIERRIADPAPLPAKLPSPFGRDELAEWRKVLLDHRSEISQDIHHLEQGAMEAEDGHTTPNHIAERGSDAEMQDMSLGLAGEEQVLLWQIDRALRKIETASPIPFGLCEHTKQPIPKTRLQLIPWTPVSIEGMNYVEENGLTLEDVLVDG